MTWFRATTESSAVLVDRPDSPGMKVHNAVFNSNEKISGVTVHYVNEEYDKGPVLLQEKIDITDCSNPKQIAKKVLKLEHEIFPKAIIKHLKNINKYEKN